MAIANGPGEILPAKVSPSAPLAFRPTTDRQVKAQRRVRAWKRHRERWAKQRTECLNARRYVALLAEQRARPYELGDARHVLRTAMSVRAVELLEHLFAIERGFARGGAVMRHADAAAMLQCSERTAGDVVRELLALGLVEQRPHFRPRTDAERAPKSRQDVLDGVSKHVELTPAYSTTKRAREFCLGKGARISRKKQDGKNCQPGENQRSLRERQIGVRGRGRPERAFASDVTRPRQDANAVAPHARVIERLPDGRVLLGSPLVGGVGRLANARVATTRDERTADDKRDFIESDACARAWAAFEALQRGGGA